MAQFRVLYVPQRWRMVRGSPTTLDRTRGAGASLGRRRGISTAAKPVIWKHRTDTPGRDTCAEPALASCLGCGGQRRLAGLVRP